MLLFVHDIMLVSDTSEYWLKSVDFGKCDQFVRVLNFYIWRWNKMYLLFYIFISRYSIKKLFSLHGGQGWHSGENAHLLPVCSGLIPAHCHMLVESVVGSCLAPRVFSRFSSFSPSIKTNISKFQFNQGRRPHENQADMVYPKCSNLSTEKFLIWCCKFMFFR